MRTVQFSRIASLRELVQGWHVVRVSVGPRADPVVLCSDKDLGYDIIQQGEQVEVCHRSEGHIRLRIFHLRNGYWEMLTLPPIERDLHFIAQPYGTGEWLIVRPRLPWGSTHDNATIYSADGCALRSFYVSDAVEDVQVTEDRQVWVSYFDEGAMTGDELAQSGLVCFDPSGQVVFRFSDLAEREELSHIDDCYALNVESNDSVWLTYYGYWPLVHLHGRSLHQHWNDFPVTLSHGFAVADERILFGDGHLASRSERFVKPDDPNLREFVTTIADQLQERLAHPKLYLVGLTTLSVETLQPADAGGRPLGRSRFFGRGSRLYAVSADEVLSVDLSTLELGPRT